MGKLLWSPTEEQQSQSEINRFKQYVEQRYQLSFASYHELWGWSTAHILTRPADSASFIGTKWFSGATLNCAEHVFRRETGTDTNAFAHSYGFLHR
ncbi:hypothetical protein [Sphingobacterium sp. DR205]|uniref:hypothetical protein n=1 Tax=Sphingobacterium sp. DR205 TaxID=2713573 RepID=UPI001F493B4C|nr:hypothetical protein [Sphingobacterium sp. DR205]